MQYGTHVQESTTDAFRVTLSADFLDQQRKLIFPDISLSLFENVPGLSYGFLPDFRTEYDPEQLADCDVLISLKPRVTARSIAGNSRLCAIGRCGVGYDNVDVQACTEQDIAVYITPTAVVRPVAESILLFVLALSHGLVEKDRMIRKGQWVESTRKLGREPRDRIIGTVGLGNIGSEAIRLLKPLNVARFLAFDPYTTPENARDLGVELTTLEDVLRQSDYVLINCPLTPETRGIIGSAQFALMKPEAVLINTARGPIVNQADLIQALKTNRIRGAALDVFEREPLEADSELLKLDNVILTSHSVGWTEELFRDMGKMDCEGALAVFRGDPPLHVVNRDVLSRPGFQQKLKVQRERRMVNA